MIIRPVFNILLLPDITYFFKRDFFPGAAADQIEVGTDILFPFLKNEVDETTVTIDDIYPVGMSARVESIGDDDSIQIRTLERVSLDDIELNENGQITATASIRPEVRREADFHKPAELASEICSELSMGDLGKKLHYPEKEYL